MNTEFFVNSRLRKAVLGATVLLAAFVVVRFAHLDGLLRRVTIDGPSMAPGWCGAHRQVRCDDCGFLFRCDAEHLPADGLAACPNCGFTSNALEKSRSMPAESVVIDRWPLLWRGLKRGDVVAFRAPGGDLAIKRVAGLKGEKLVIQEGDLFANGQLIRKDRAEVRTVQMLVHDSNHAPQKTTGLPDRWRGAGPESRWQRTEAVYQIEAVTSEAFDWLQYVHWPCTADARTRGVPSPVLDNDGYNQGETRRALNSVSDVTLSCRLRTAGQGRFAMEAIDGDQRFVVEIEPEKMVMLTSGELRLVEKPLKTSFSGRAAKVEFGLCDQQVLLVIDGRTVIRHDYERVTGPRTEPLHPLAIGAADIGLEIEEICVWRDIHYLDRVGLPRRWEAAPLKTGEFALLGDNQPVSIDSRHWEKPGIGRHKILGHVYRPFWTAK